MEPLREGPLRCALEDGLRAQGLSLPSIGIQTEEEVDSTNLRLKEWARSGRIGPPYLLAADCQTAGRGRLGRRFVSPAGTGLYMSVLLSPPLGADPGKITILAAVAVCRALEEMTPLQPRIKWVNDIFVRGKKVCGILAEKIDQGVIIGIGVNVLTPPGGFPPEAGIAGALDASMDRSCLAGRISAHLLAGIRDLDSPSILQAYRQRMPLTGQIIHFVQDGQEKSARVTGVGEDGALLIETPMGPDRLRCGEVSLGSQSFSGLE